jgi:OCT family organic cation transporter-like MFS transporter 4/5
MRLIAVFSKVYYGISFNTSELAGDPYVNFTLSAAVEVVAITCCHLTLDRFGRKKPYAFNMLLSGSVHKRFVFIFQQIC